MVWRLSTPDEYQVGVVKCVRDCICICLPDLVASIESSRENSEGNWANKVNWEGMSGIESEFENFCLVQRLG